MKNNTAVNRNALLAFRALILVCISVFFVKFSYENRCHIINCSPASWEKILNLALAQSGEDFRIESIIARPSSWSTYTETGPTFVVINVSYVSLDIDRSQTIGVAGKIANHPLKDLEFDDQTLITHVPLGNGWTSEVPPEDRQEKLQSVTVHPRDAFRTTWALARKEAGLYSDDIHAFATLIFDMRGYESIWKVTYVYDKTVLNFYVDAQTGQIISSEKNVMSK